VRKPALQTASSMPAHGPRSAPALPAWSPSVPQRTPVVADTPFSFNVEGFHRDLFGTIPSLKAPPPVRHLFCFPDSIVWLRRRD
jgi:hypothetical protein